MVIFLSILTILIMNVKFCFSKEDNYNKNENSLEIMLIFLFIGWLLGIMTIATFGITALFGFIGSIMLIIDGEDIMIYIMVIIGIILGLIMLFKK